MTFDERLMQIVKFLCAVVGFFVVFLANIVWLLLFPVIKIIGVKQAEKSGVPFSLGPLQLIEWYMPWAVKFCGGTA